MKSEPLAPRAPAIYLYRQVDRNDMESSVHIYNRIKIFTEEGRNYANIKIPYNKNRQRVRGIEARTIRPDGSIVEFNGDIYDQTLLKGQDGNMAAKVFTLTDVQVGSIIEYRFLLLLDDNYVFDSNWVLNEDLFTKYAKFSLVPNEYFALMWSWPLGLPPGTKPPEKVGAKIRMETNDVAAFVEEDYMPPESAVKMRVDFIYREVDLADKEPEKFWKHFGKKSYKKFDDFIDSSSAMKKAVTTMIEPGDSTETKARKLYARVQKLRNLSFERSKSDAEEKREDLKINRDVEDVLTRGYGGADQINWLYIALARAAGLQAQPVLISTRDYNFIAPAMMNSSQLNTYVVQLNIDGAEVFVDPGTVFAPFGVLPWNETGVNGLKLDKDGGVWVATPMPKAELSGVERHATLSLDEFGTLEGKLQVTYRGLTALSLRLNGRFDDATEHKKDLENLVKSYVPVGVDVTLSNTPDWSAATPTMLAEFDLRVTGWMQNAGSRGLFPAALFGNETRHDFDHVSRQHPIYFRYPFTYNDEVTVTLPANWRVDTLPPVQDKDLKHLVYNLKVEQQDGKLLLHRKLLQQLLLLDVKYYDSLRDFYQDVRNGDEQQVIFVSAGRAAKAH